jgi:hypothetical protein
MEVGKPNTEWEACNSRFVQPNDSCWLKIIHQGNKMETDIQSILFNYEKAKKPHPLNILTLEISME